MLIRLVQMRTKRETSGLAIGFGIPRDCDQALRKALPNWDVVLTDEAPAATHATLAAMRRAASVDSDTPLLLIGFDKGTQTVFRMVLSNLHSAAVGLAFFDGEYPTDDHSLDVWRSLSLASGAGEGPRLVVDLASPQEAILEALGLARSEAGKVDPEEPTTDRLARFLGHYFGPAAAPTRKTG